MKKAYSIRNDKQFILAWNAMCSFKKAQDILFLLKKSNEAGKQHISMSLFGAICGYYAAPFMTNNNLGSLPESLMPAGYKRLHKDMLTMRNKVFMHLDKDVEIFEVKFATHPRIIVRQGKEITIEAKSWMPGDMDLIAIDALLKLLVRILHQNAISYIKNKLRGMGLPPGEYVVVTEDSNLKLGSCLEQCG